MHHLAMHAIKQFLTTQQTAHFQTILVLTWMDVLNARMIVTQNSEVSLIVLYPFTRQIFVVYHHKTSFHQKTDAKFGIRVSALPRITSFSLTGHRNLQKTR